MTTLDRVLGTLAPRWQLQRTRARLAGELLERHYEAASAGRRTQGWRRGSGDANAAINPYTGRLRDVARNLVRNNPYAESALSTIVDHTVGWGIEAKPRKKHRLAAALWHAWAATTACDADGRHTFAGLQKLVMRTVVESGEVLVRRRWRTPKDRLPIPLQLQVLEPDYLDSYRDVELLDTGGRIINGIELDAIGRRVAYWIYPDHPGAMGGMRPGFSQRVPADGVLHIFKAQRPGQQRGPSWFGPVLLRFKDFDEFEDATLMKQKIAACLAVITSDVDGTGPALGGVATDNPEIDELAPGMILNVPPGRNIEVVQPPTVREYADYTQTTLRSIATGLGVAYEDLTGDYTNLPFSAARMSRLRHWQRVDDWRWHLMVPQFCDPVWRWAMEAAAVMGLQDPPEAEWTAPPIPMIDPDKEGLAYQRNIRTGIMTLSEAIRERGYDPESLLTEMQTDNQLLDRLGLVLDSDPRRMNQQGMAQPAQATGDSSAKDNAADDRDDADETPDGTTPRAEQTIFGYHLQYGVAKLGDARKNLNLPPDSKTDHMTVPEYLKWLDAQQSSGKAAP